MVRREDLIGNLPAALLADATGRSVASFKKLTAAKERIEREVAAGQLSPESVTLQMILKDYAGLNHRFLDRDVYAHEKKEILQWKSALASIRIAVPSNEQATADIIERQKAEIAALEERLEKMSDRIHFYASRIRDLQRTNRQLKKKSLETVVYVRDRDHSRSKSP